MTALENPKPATYVRAMDKLIRDGMPPQEWLDVLAESEADLAAGRVVQMDAVLRDLDEAIARLEAQGATSKNGKAASGR